MPRTVQPGETVIETWEITGNFTVWVWVYDRREDKYKKQRVGGRDGGSKRLHISVDDRRFNQEQVVEEMKTADPFVNGALILVSAEKAEDIDATYHLTGEDLANMLEVKDLDLFNEEINDIKSELILRRLRELAETQGTVKQLESIQDLLNSRYKIGGTQRTVREMIEAGERIGGEVLTERL